MEQILLAYGLSFSLSLSLPPPPQKKKSYYCYNNAQSAGDIGCINCISAEMQLMSASPAPEVSWILILNNMIGSSNAEALGNAEYFFCAILPGPPWAGVVAPDRVLSMGQI